MMKLLNPIFHYAWKNKNLCVNLTFYETVLQIVVATEKSVPEQCEEESINSYKSTGARTWPHPFTWSFEVTICLWLICQEEWPLKKKYTWSTNLSSRNTINSLRLVVKEACRFSRTLDYNQEETSVLTDWLMEARPKRHCAALFESHWPRKALKQSCTLHSQCRHLALCFAARSSTIS